MYLHWAVWNRFIKSWREVIIGAEIGGWDRWIKKRDEIGRQRDQSICLPSIRRSRSSAFSSWEKSWRQERVVNYPRMRRIVNLWNLSRIYIIDFFDFQRGKVEQYRVSYVICTLYFIINKNFFIRYWGKFNCVIIPCLNSYM